MRKHSAHLTLLQLQPVICRDAVYIPQKTWQPLKVMQLEHPAWRMRYTNCLNLPYFFDQTPWLLFYSLFFLVWLVFEGSLYFIGEAADSNDGWNKYMWAIQLGLIDAGSSTWSLSVLLSAVETSFRTWTPLEIAQWAIAAIISMHVHVQRILAMATNPGWHLFCSEFPIVWILFEGDDYSRWSLIEDKR